jgi:DNA-binding transcriptional ArsR family regulator
MNGTLQWKRCRILANPVRLEMLSLLDGRPRMFVQAIGEHLGCSEDAASKHLQLLAEGGFLVAEREGCYLFYSVSRSDPLAAVVLREINADGSDMGSMLKALTAFTHERRIEILAQLAQGAMGFRSLCLATKISREAMKRHLKKLERRGFVEGHDDCWVRSESVGVFGRELMACMLG